MCIIKQNRFCRENITQFFIILFRTFLSSTYCIKTKKRIFSVFVMLCYLVKIASIAKHFTSSSYCTVYTLYRLMVKANSCPAILLTFGHIYYYRTRLYAVGGFFHRIRLYAVCGYFYYKSVTNIGLPHCQKYLTFQEGDYTFNKVTLQ